MTDGLQAVVPPPVDDIFAGCIRHPDLWLWDSWTFSEGERDHLYCLAFPRRDASGRNTTPAERNDFRFHVRHFESSDDGLTWRDRGAFFVPDAGPGSDRLRNVWTGALARRNDGGALFAFTAIPERGGDRPFLQQLRIVETDSPDTADPGAAQIVSDPERDYDRICAAGYYLGSRDRLGDAHGEEGGPILAWRDPFIHIERGKAHLFWAAKLSSHTGAVGHAEIARDTNGAWRMTRLSAPVALPDAHCFSQIEVPKVYRRGDGSCLLLVSTSTRKTEDQPEDDVVKHIRLYRGETILGPWSPYGEDSVILENEDIYGASLLSLDAHTGRLVAPLSEHAGADERLTIGPVQILQLS